jgi:signal recognition particle receptor subunit alpha
METVLEKMCDLLIAKNVAADIARKLCESVAVKLDGKVISNFSPKISAIEIINFPGDRHL